VINSVKTDPCGNIRRVNVEIPTLSVSDMRRLKATDCVSIHALAAFCALSSVSSRRASSSSCSKSGCHLQLLRSSGVLMGDC
jgi:hypothetical protein